MKASSGTGWATAALMVFCMMGLGFSGCHKNEKLSVDTNPTDGDIDGDSDIDGDMDTEEEVEMIPPSLSLSKWLSGNGSHLSFDGQGRLVSASKAGLVLLDMNGTPDDRSDDTREIRSELTEDVWPTTTVVDACSDGSDAIWFADKTGLFRLAPGDDDDPAPVLKAALDDTLTGGRDLLQLLCLHGGDGLWVSTSFGFLEIAAGDSPDDPNSWTVTDHRDDGDMLAKRPHYAALDAADRLWITIFDVDTYKLYASVGGSTSEIAFGFADPSPTALAADGDSGLWIVNDESSWYFGHGGTPSDTADDTWIELPAPSGLSVNTLIPVAAGQAVAYKDNLRDFFLLDTKNTADGADDAVTLLPQLGMDDSNKLVSAVVQDESIVWFSSQNDFGTATLADDPASDGWVRKRIIDLGLAPANDLAGFTVTDDRVFLGGPNGVVAIELGDGDPDAFAFNAYALEAPGKLTPFNIQVLDTVSDGLLVGGEVLAIMDEAGAFSTWEAKSPTSISMVAKGESDILWLTSVQQSIVTVISFAVYDYNGTPQTALDDKTENIDTDYFGFNAGAAADCMAFFDGCKALIGNSLGLHYYDCNATPLDPADDIAETGLLDGAKLIKHIEHIGDGAFFITTLSGLHYLDTAGTADTGDDTIVKYEHTGQSASFAIDGAGRIVTFIEGGFLLRDPMDTPDDPADDLGAFFAIDWTLNSRVVVDAQNNWWFDTGDGSGIYHGAFDPGSTLLPIADVLAGNTDDE